MRKFELLMAEVEAIRTAWNWGILESIMYIGENLDDYPYEIRVQYNQFIIDGARMFAPKEYA